MRLGVVRPIQVVLRQRKIIEHPRIARSGIEGPGQPGVRAPHVLTVSKNPGQHPHECRIVPDPVGRLLREPYRVGTASDGEQAARFFQRSQRILRRRGRNRIETGQGGGHVTRGCTGVRCEQAHDRSSGKLPQQRIGDLLRGIGAPGPEQSGTVVQRILQSRFHPRVACFRSGSRSKATVSRGCCDRKGMVPCHM